jgi:hypothetical protein
MHLTLSFSSVTCYARRIFIALPGSYAELLSEAIYLHLRPSSTERRGNPTKRASGLRRSPVQSRESYLRKTGISWEGLPTVPQISDPQVISEIHRFRQTLDDYNQAAKERRDLQAAAHRSDVDALVVFFLPLSLSLALALQTTKTTYDAWWKES